MRTRKEEFRRGGGVSGAVGQEEPRSTFHQGTVTASLSPHSSLIRSQSHTADTSLPPPQTNTHTTVPHLSSLCWEVLPSTHNLIQPRQRMSDVICCQVTAVLLNNAVQLLPVCYRADRGAQHGLLLRCGRCCQPLFSRLLRLLLLAAWTAAAAASGPPTAAPAAVPGWGPFTTEWVIAGEYGHGSNAVVLCATQPAAASCQWHHMSACCCLLRGRGDIGGHSRADSHTCGEPACVDLWSCADSLSLRQPATTTQQPQARATACTHRHCTA